MDFYAVSSGQFQGLQNLCTLAQNTLEINLEIFANTSFISDTAKTKEVTVIHIIRSNIIYLF